MLIATFLEWRKLEKAYLMGRKVYCPDCHGFGETEHHCDCEFCVVDTACGNCDGQGRITYDGIETITELSRNVYFSSVFSDLSLLAAHTGDDFLGLAGAAIKQEGHP